MRYLFLILLCALLQAETIFLDGRFDEWQDLSPAYSDPSGDHLGEIDLLTLRLAADSNRFFMDLEVADDLLLQDENTLTLLLDADADPSTGTLLEGMGVELRWVFGERSGNVYLAGSSSGVSQAELGIITPPTITGTRFEIALNRRLPLPGGCWVSIEDSIGIVLQANVDGSGDRLPDGDEGLYLPVSHEAASPWIPVSPARIDVGDLRLVSFNVLFNGIGDDSRRDAFVRILGRLNADIIAFQEVGGMSNEEIGAFLDAFLPLPGPLAWSISAAEGDVVTASRYPILNSWVIWDYNGSRITADLILVSNEERIMVINSHWSCCTANALRQAQADATIAFIRDAQTPGDDLDLVNGTPIIVTGDLNLVGDAQQLETLLTGDIQDEASYGSDHSPDWDGSNLTDLFAMHLSDRVAYTWRDASSSFSPGKLDYVVYTDSYLQVRKAFILNSATLNAEQLAFLNLQSDDSETCSDHLPVVVDFANLVNDVDFNDQVPDVNFKLYPNPTNQRLTFILNEQIASVTKVSLFDLSGREVLTTKHAVTGGAQHIDMTSFDAGIYLLRVETAEGRQLIRKLTYLP